MKQSVKIILSVFILLALLILIIPTLQDEMHWTFASLIDNTGCYNSYLKSWPRGKHIAEAKVLYDDYSWIDAVDDNSVQGYEDYIENHKNGKYFQIAWDSLESAELKFVLNQETGYLLLNFIKKYPDNQYIDSVLQTYRILDEKNWETAVSKNTCDSYTYYLSQYQEGKHLDEAKAQIRILNTRTRILEFNSAFGKDDKITDGDLKKYMQCIDNETYSTIIKKPMEYYIIKGNGNDMTKSKVVVESPPGAKGCSLELEADDLSMTAVYLAQSPIDGPLFPEKWSPDFVHTGDAGPGLEIESPSYHPLNNFRIFLDTYSISYRSIYSAGGGFKGYVIPDLVWGSHKDAYPHPHNGCIVQFDDDVFKVDGIIGMPKEKITTYEQALELKTYLKIFCSK